MKFLKAISIILIFGVVFLFAIPSNDYYRFSKVEDGIFQNDTPPVIKKYLERLKLTENNLTLKDTLNSIIHFNGIDSVFSFLGNRLTDKPFYIDEYIRKVDKILIEYNEYKKSSALIESEMSNQEVYLFPSIKYNLPLIRKHTGSIKDTFFLNTLELIYLESNKYNVTNLLDTLYQSLFDDYYFDMDLERFNHKAFSKLRTLIYTSARFGCFDCLNKYANAIEYGIEQYDTLEQEYIYTFIAKSYASIKYNKSEKNFIWSQNTNDESNRYDFERRKFKKSCEYFLKAKKLGSRDNSYLSNLIFDYNDDYSDNSGLINKGKEYTNYTKDILKYYHYDPKHYDLFINLLQLAIDNQTTSFEYNFALAYYNYYNYPDVSNKLYNKLAESVITSNLIYKKEMGLSIFQNPIYNLNLDSAIKLFNYFKNVSLYNLQLNAYISMAYCYKKNNKIKKGIETLKEAQKIAELNNDREFINKINSILKDFYIQKKSYKWIYYNNYNYWTSIRINNSELYKDLANVENEVNQCFAERELKIVQGDLSIKQQEILKKSKFINAVKRQMSMLEREKIKILKQKIEIENQLNSSNTKLQILLDSILKKEIAIASKNKELQILRDKLIEEQILLANVKVQKDKVDKDKLMALSDKNKAIFGLYVAIILTLLIILGTFVWSYFKIKRITFRKELIEKSAIAKPHFLGNALNSIINESNENFFESKKRLIDLLHSINSQIKVNYSIYEELKLCTNYLRYLKECSGIGYMLEYNVNFDLDDTKYSNLKSIKIIPTAILDIILNAEKYAITYNVDNGVISIINFDLDENMNIIIETPYNVKAFNNKHKIYGTGIGSLLRTGSFQKIKFEESIENNNQLITKITI